MVLKWTPWIHQSKLFLSDSKSLFFFVLMGYYIWITRKHVIWDFCPSLLAVPYWRNNTSFIPMALCYRALKWLSIRLQIAVHVSICWRYLPISVPVNVIPGNHRSSIGLAIGSLWTHASITSLSGINNFRVNRGLLVANFMSRAISVISQRDANDQARHYPSHCYRNGLQFDSPTPTLCCRY